MKLIQEGRIRSTYADMEAAAKAKGYVISYDASPENTKIASQAKSPDGSLKYDEVIYNNRGSQQGTLGINGDISLYSIFFPTDGGKRTILSCHVEKVVSPERIKQLREGGTNLGSDACSRHH